MGYCDHSPYWNIKLNGKIIYDSGKDSLLEERVYQLKFSNLKLIESDTLIITYKTDTRESGENHLYFRNYNNKIILNISTNDRAIFTLTKNEFDIIANNSKLYVDYIPSWSKYVNFETAIRLIEIN